MKTNALRLSAILILSPVFGFSQTVLGNNKPLDGVYDEVHNPHRRVVPLAGVKEADVMWQKRVWRMIDLREKMNLTLYYPVTPNNNRRSMWDVMSQALTAGELTAYDFNINDLDDCWSTPMTKEEINNAIHSVDTITDPDTGEKHLVHAEVSSASMKKYMMKEDWFFERERSVLDERIIGMAPLKAAINKNTHAEDAASSGEPMFWLYFNSLRPFFAAQPMFNGHNDHEWRTLDDIMMKRQFSSYIYKENNVYNRTISDYYTNSLDALLEGQKIHADIAAIEHDMWQY